MRYCNVGICKPKHGTQCVDCFLTDITARLLALNDRLQKVYAEMGRYETALRAIAANDTDNNGPAHRVAQRALQMEKKQVLN